MTYTTRRRILRKDLISSETYRTASGVRSLVSQDNIVLYSRQITTSEGHAWPRDRGVRDAGGDFDTLKLEYRNMDWGSYSSEYPRSSGLFETYGGSYPYSAQLPAVFLSEEGTDTYFQSWVPASTDSALTARGTKYVAETLPTNPIVDSSVALAELYREGIPHLIGATLLKNRADFIRSLGSEYLNYQFGWKPLVSDVRNAAKAVMDQHKILAQLKRDSGRDVHRKRISPTETQTVQVVQNLTTPFAGHTGDAFQSMWYRTSDVVKRRQWFSGCYTYCFEPSLDDEVERIAKEARLLYGLQLTPEVLWNLAPWSWLVDWVTNVGPVLHNLTSFQQDGLVMRYGYVMEFNSREYKRFNTRGAIRSGGKTSYPLAAADVFSGQRKLRRKATPFGFGLLESSFTTRQWAILAALGITRAPKRL